MHEVVNALRSLLPHLWWSCFIYRVLKLRWGDHSLNFVSICLILLGLSILQRQGVGHDYTFVPHCCNSFCISGQCYHYAALYSSNHKVLYCYGFGFGVLWPAISSRHVCKVLVWSSFDHLNGNQNFKHSYCSRVKNKHFQRDALPFPLYVNSEHISEACCTALAADCSGLSAYLNCNSILHQMIFFFFFL